MDETTGSVGSPKPAELALSDEQRGRIFDGVMLVPDAKVAHVAAPAVADPLPRDVPLHDCLPASPATFRSFEGHQFAKFDDRIWSSIRQAAWSSR